MKQAFPLLLMIFTLSTVNCGGPKNSPAESTAPPASALPAVTVKGNLDVPQNGAELTSEITVAGWAFANGSPVQSVNVFLDGKEISSTAIAGARPDVAQAFAGEPAALNSGFMTVLPTASVPAGQHQLEARATTASGVVQSVGKVTISIKK